MLRSLTTQPIRLFSSTGVEVRPAPTGSYTATIIVANTSTPAAAAAIWAMRLSPTATVSAYIRRIVFSLSFHGTTGGAKSLGCDWMRFSGATHTGGSAEVPRPKHLGMPLSQVTDARFSTTTALTDTSVVYETPFATFRIPTSVTSWEQVCDLDFTVPGQPFGDLVLAPGEGIAMQMNQTAIAGQTETGFVEWDER